jgi:hypothetical protein
MFKITNNSLHMFRANGGTEMILERTVRLLQGKSGMVQIFAMGHKITTHNNIDY